MEKRFLEMLDPLFKGQKSLHVLQIPMWWLTKHVGPRERAKVFSALPRRPGSFRGRKKA